MTPHEFFTLKNALDMKTVLKMLFVGSVWCGLCSPASAQWFLSGGANVSWMQTDELAIDFYRARLTPLIGLGRRFALNEYMAYEPALHYADFGGRLKVDSVDVDQKYWVHALVLDQYFTYSLNERWHVALSPTIWYAFSARYLPSPTEEGGEVRPWRGLRPWAFSLFGRVGYAASDRMVINLFWRRDLSSIGNVFPDQVAAQVPPESKDNQGYGFGLQLQYRLGGGKRR